MKIVLIRYHYTYDGDYDDDDDNDDDAPHVPLVKRRLASWQPLLLRTTLYLSQA